MKLRTSCAAGLFWRLAGLTVGCVGVAIITAGCYGTGGGAGRGLSADRSDLRIRAEAYSFNARLRRDSKPTTFKLEIYQTDSLLGLSGRGYLGKGALKGWLNSDSVKVYFPSAKELLYESLSDLVAGLGCPFPLADLDLLDLFRKLPDTTLRPEDLLISPDYGNAKRPRFRIESRRVECLWGLDIVYDRQKAGWRVRRFEFDNGGGTILRAVRERYKAGAKVPVKRFRVQVPPEAVRITP